MHAPASVIIPCYHSAATITRAVESVAAQTLKPAEVILVDDGSGDGTVDVLREIRDAYPQGWVKTVLLPENRGAASARNAGWETAAQPYIAFLDADDSWHPRKIELQYRFMQEHPDIAMSGHLWQLAKEEKSVPGTPEISVMPTWKLMLTNPFVTPSVMLKANLPFRFREGQRHMEDHLLWLEIVLAGHNAVMLHAPLAILHKRYGVGGLSAQQRAMQKADFANWMYLWRARRIGLAATAGMMLLSLLKYTRRVGMRLMGLTFTGSGKAP